MDEFQLKQIMRDTEETVAKLNNEIGELEEDIRAQNQQVHEISAQLVLHEREREQLNIEMNEIHKEKELLEMKLEKDRRNFENEMQWMISELTISKVCTSNNSQT